MQQDLRVSTASVLGDLSNELVRIHKGVCGKGPTDARTFSAGETIVCVMKGGMTQADRVLAENNLAAATESHRRALNQVLGPQATMAVERLVGRTVSSTFYDVDPVANVEVMVFLLDED
jgi:uncharacterized protein YbcI